MVHLGGITINGSVLEVEEFEDCPLPLSISRLSIQVHHINLWLWLWLDMEQLL